MIIFQCEMNRYHVNHFPKEIDGFIPKRLEVYKFVIFMGYRLNNYREHGFYVIVSELSGI